MTYPVRAYVGAGAAGTISNSGGISSSFSGALTSSTSLSSWVSSQTRTLNNATYIVIAVDYGTATEEKILCTWQSSSSLNIITRGYDGTTAVAHNLGSLFIPVWSATEAQEANNAVQSLLPLLNNSGSSTTPVTVSGTTVNAQGSSTIAAAIDHTHALNANALTPYGQFSSSSIPLTGSPTTVFTQTISGHNYYLINFSATVSNQSPTSTSAQAILSANGSTLLSTGGFSGAASLISFTYMYQPGVTSAITITITADEFFGTSALMANASLSILGIN